MPRVQTGPINGPEQVQAQSQGVSTLHNPGIRPPAETNSFLQLAGALQGMQPELNRFLDNRMNEVTQSDIETGKAAALKNKMAFKDAVKAGQIPAGANPWFIQGYHEQEQRLAGQSFDRALREAWAGSEIRNTDDPAAFQSWMQTFTQEYTTKSGDLEKPMAQVFAQQVQASQANLSSYHGNYRAQQIEAGVIENTKQEIVNSLDMAYMFRDNQALADHIKQTVDRQVGNGLNGTIANKLTVDALVQKAYEKEDINILNFMDTIDTASGKLGYTSYAREEKLRAINSISAIGLHKANQQEKAQEELVKNSIRDLGSEMNTRMLTQGYNADVKDLIAKGNDIDPKVSSALITMNKQMINFQTDVTDDPEYVTALGAKVLFDDDFDLPKFLNDVQNNGSKISPATRVRYLNDLNEKINNPQWMRGSWMGMQMSDLERIVLDSNSSETSTGPNIPITIGGNTVNLGGGSKKSRNADAEARANGAKVDYLEALRNNRKEAKGMNDLQERMQKQVDIIRKRWSPGGEGKTADEPAAAKPKQDEETPEMKRKAYIAGIMAVDPGADEKEVGLMVDGMMKSLEKKDK